MGPGMVQGQHGGVRYHRRYLEPTPFVLAAFTTLGFGVVIAVLHSGIGTLSGLILIPTFLTFFYLDGPAKSVTVRHDTLEVRNSIRRYAIPAARILTIEHVAPVGVLVRVEGHRPIWVNAMSRGRFRWRNLSTAELETNAKSLSDALFATPAPAGQRQVQAGYRWVNLLLIAACGIGLLILNGAVNKS
jgi:hypothetical protein